MGKAKLSILIEINSFSHKHGERALQSLAHLSELLSSHHLDIPYEFLVFTPEGLSEDNLQFIKFTKDILALQKRRKLKYELKYVGPSPKKLLKILSMTTGELLIPWPSDFSIHSRCLLDAYSFYQKEKIPFIFGSRFHPESTLINFDDHQIIVYKEKLLSFFKHEYPLTLYHTKDLKEVINHLILNEDDHLKCIPNKIMKDSRLNLKYKMIGLDWIYTV